MAGGPESPRPPASPHAETPKLGREQKPSANEGLIFEFRVLQFRVQGLEFREFRAWEHTRHMQES